MSEIRFQVGDIVSRDGTDRHRVIEVRDGGYSITVVCIKEPLGWLNEDGTRDRPWCKLGDEDWNLARRYDFADLPIEGTAREHQTALLGRNWDAE